jgi:hypothetical protein
MNMLLCISLIKRSRDYRGVIREAKLVIKKGEESQATSREVKGENPMQQARGESGNSRQALNTVSRH